VTAFRFDVRARDPMLMPASLEPNQVACATRFVRIPLSLARPKPRNVIRWKTVLD
jgi:hypothetical protein